LDSEELENQPTVEDLIANSALLEEYVQALSASARRERQYAARQIAAVSHENAEVLAPYGNKLIAALECPEAQTRWECIDALTQLIPVESRLCDKAIPGAEAGLFDEDSGPLRFMSMRFLCRLGATTEKRSERVWPLIDEGIQCCHGDLEFQDMLLAVIDFAQGKLAPQVKAQLADRMRFDAINGHGLLKRRATQIVELVS
jgi:hypothetical protein